MLEPPLLFDLDGTLVDSLPDIAASVNTVRVAFGRPELTLAEVRELVGDGLETLLARALPNLGPPDRGRAARLYREHHREQCTRPGRGTMIGDGVQDLHGGPAAGLRTTAVLFGHGQPRSLRARGPTSSGPPSALRRPEAKRWEE
jgi:phosphoglycolate phosphatase-like HAD superfamily hydrolase